LQFPDDLSREDQRLFPLLFIAEQDFHAACTASPTAPIQLWVSHCVSRLRGLDQDADDVPAYWKVDRESSVAAPSWRDVPSGCQPSQGATTDDPTLPDR
jgi:hypothetical protein